MQTIDLASASDELRAAAEDAQANGDVALLTLGGVACGLLLPPQEAQRLATRYAAPAPAADPVAGGAEASAQNYLELLRDNPALVPVIDGQRLEFVTMMNSSYISPEQLYQFKHPVTRQVYLYRASELRQAIGRSFISVDFIPLNPKAFVESGHRS